MKSLQRGFTLLELMVTLAIVGIVALIALWDSSDMLENDRAESYLLELKRTLSFARAKATSSDAIIVVCSGNTSRVESNRRVPCLNDWSQGTVFVFFDSNQNGVYNPRVGDIILRVMEEVPENSQLNFTGDNFITFDTSGMLTSNTGKFTYCPSKADDDNNKQLEVFASGTALYIGSTTDGCN
ncbi:MULTISPECIES: GspH/FimT family pseudopilin [Pseudoalteromonas]|uniref:GspH/FimT family pseudopilin n=1 Tax=Pseudoalteromonas TaxID=53246 RepID=UPI0006DD28A8|nr:MULTISPECIES: GspH/FimT family pseudopilin [Pseudoalteromonas]KPW04870.1 Type II transport protein GspH [Pseudoalteromonas sp. P1-8]MCG9733816.1 GspH/FimT family pseudopilin [Pseudoalteromonas shioyasakiensis]URQ85290.1 GspH/FimT family pseudopilin [Pseudoalteromonas sp. SCSIO 43088]